MGTKVLKGTKDARAFQVVKGPRDTRQVRCKNCGGLASQVPNGSGGTVHRCIQCGIEYKFQMI